MIKKFKHFINESLDNKSTYPYEMISLLKSEYPHISIYDSPSGEFMECITLRNGDIIDNDFLNFIDVNKWYISRTNPNIEIRPKYSSGIIENVPKYLLHATPSENVDNILRYGLLSKSNDLRHKYPKRIYMANKVSTIRQLIVEMKRYSGKSEYSIFEIDMSKVDTILYKDDTCMFMDCYYIQDYDISPNFIKIIKR